VPIASRTPEGEAFSCKVCGAVDRIEPSPSTGEAVCPRCGGYLARLLGDIDYMVGNPATPISLDTELGVIAGYDSFDVAEWVWEWEGDFGVRANGERVAECRTLADLICYLVSLLDRE
jgi:acyl carrier protein